MVIDQDTGAHWRPEKPGAALAWAQPQEPPAEPMDDVRPNPMFVHEVMEGVSRLCRFWIDVAESLKRDQVYVSAGQYTVTPDDKPIIGPHPEIEGLFFNTGYSGHGIMGAPRRRSPAGRPGDRPRLMTRLIPSVFAGWPPWRMLGPATSGCSNLNDQ